jgi:hypothetical protein
MVLKNPSLIPLLGNRMMNCAGGIHIETKLCIEALLAKTRQLKQSMMQQLLIGRIRLVEPDSDVRKSENHEIRTSEGGLKYENPESEFRKVAEHE